MPKSRHGKESGVSDSRLPTPPAAPQAEQAVDARLLYLAYQRLPLSLLISLVMPLIFFGLMWPFFPSAPMTAWLIAIMTGVAARYVQWAAFRRAAPAPDALSRWRKLYLIGTAVAGAAWSVGPTLMMPEASRIESALFVGTLFSVCAVAVSAQSAQQTAMQTFLFIALVPPAVAFWLTGGDVERTLALLLIAGLVSLIVVGRRSHQATRALIETESRMHTIIETEPECIMILDARGCLVQMNPAGLAMIEADSLEQAIGQPILDFIAPAYRAGFAELHQRVIAGESRQMEFEALGLKGTRRWLDTHAVPMQDRGETVQLAGYLPAAKPTLVWMWAPH